ncbi:uncharacterized protein LOC126378178 [Pectinophora gossypiella]|uniref:uncharacterized protein LOC126378178 n=1 Tax=Pectinophora gossypiella TaxID=13191 RepID=UPI00214F1BC5|nr:uncharacterized protein LOC126378178 [Pectinophora gossypiella]
MWTFVLAIISFYALSVKNAGASFVYFPAAEVSKDEVPLHEGYLVKLTPHNDGNGAKKAERSQYYQDSYSAENDRSRDRRNRNREEESVSISVEYPRREVLYSSPYGNQRLCFDCNDDFDLNARASKERYNRHSYRLPTGYSRYSSQSSNRHVNRDVNVKGSKEQFNRYYSSRQAPSYSSYASNDDNEDLLSARAVNSPYDPFGPAYYISYVHNPKRYYARNTQSDLMQNVILSPNEVNTPLAKTLRSNLLKRNIMAAIF